MCCPSCNLYDECLEKDVCCDRCGNFDENECILDGDSLVEHG
jgi:hypothetical protein